MRSWESLRTGAVFGAAHPQPLQRRHGRGVAGHRRRPLGRPEGPDADEGDHRSWSASNDPRHWNYWRREAYVYGSGLAQVWQRYGIRAPRLLECVERPDGDVALWLEDVPGEPATAWTLARHVDHAHRLGAAQGAVGAGEDAPGSRSASCGSTTAGKTTGEDLLDDRRGVAAPPGPRHFPPGLREDMVRLHHDREWFLDGHGVAAPRLLPPRPVAGEPPLGRHRRGVRSTGRSPATAPSARTSATTSRTASSTCSSPPPPAGPGQGCLRGIRAGPARERLARRRSPRTPRRVRLRRQVRLAHRADAGRATRSRWPTAARAPSRRNSATGNGDWPCRTWPNGRPRHGCWHPASGFPNPPPVAEPAAPPYGGKVMARVAELSYYPVKGCAGTRCARRC